MDQDIQHSKFINHLISIYLIFKEGRSLLILTKSCINIFFSYQMFQMTFRFNSKQFPPTSITIKLHIYCAYLQAYVWYHIVIESTINIDPELCGFTFEEDKNLVPIINDASPLPKDFPFPCKCAKSKFDKRYPCWLNELTCCQYCNCKNNCLSPL